jgi:dipeptide transport system ATP-binding protein
VFGAICMGNDEVLCAEHVSKSYQPKNRILRGPCAPVYAVHDVSLSLRPHTTLAVTGPSGSGKSTLARCLACLESFDSGILAIAGQKITDLSISGLRAARRQVQLVPQASASSLNARFSALSAVREPLDIANGMRQSDRDQLALAAINRVGLRPENAHRSSDQFSSGQRQRLALARALLCEPRVLILDESFTGLDYSVRASIANLLENIQRESGMSYILISHDTDLITYMADRTLVMRAGRLIADEIGSAGDARCSWRGI